MWTNLIVLQTYKNNTSIRKVRGEGNEKEGEKCKTKKERDKKNIVSEEKRKKCIK